MDSQTTVVNRRPEIPITYSILTSMERYSSRDVDENGCLQWLGAPVKGFGVISSRGKSFLAHEVAFVINGGEITEGHVVSQKCGVKTCVNFDHLELVTISEYRKAAHEQRLRNVRRGEDIATALTLNDVLNIKVMYEPGVFGYRRIAKHLGLSIANVRDVATGHTWKHVPVPACASHASS